ncbi:hypothetical protein [Aquimarina agarivorans]|uniref:hypothetical protein n=1 Tax=Aquimarina agarivorans TaxID=980584 RepID=UPI000248F2DD|nr:hypothetical protein [Aquimarina agarivorans]
MKKILLFYIFVINLASYAQLANADPLMVNASILRRTLKNDTLKKDEFKRTKKAIPVQKVVLEDVVKAKKELPKATAEKKEKVVKEEIVAKTDKEIRPLIIENEKDEDFYSVQIAASKVRIKKDFFQKVPTFYTNVGDGFYRYFSEQFASISEAKAYSKKIHATTKFNKAFLVRLKNGTKVPLK